MSVQGAGGGESLNFDLGNTDAEGWVGGGNVTTVTGSLRTGGKGARHWHCDASVSGGGGQVALSTAAGSGATKSVLIFVCQINNVTTPAFDVPIFRDNVTNIEIRYERLTDGKIHFFVQGTEINSAAAFTPTVGSPIGFAVVNPQDTVTDYELWYDSAASGSFAKQQHGTNAVAAAAFSHLAFCENLSKGVNHNWTLDVDDVFCQDNGGTYRTTLITIGASTSYVEAVLEGRPNADTGTNGWTDSGGTACGTGGNCNGPVSDNSDTTYDKITTSPATGSTGYQTFPTSSLFLGSSDTVYAILNSFKSNIVTPNGWALAHVLQEGSTFTTNGEATTGAGSFRYGRSSVFRDHSPAHAAEWTDATAQAADIGMAISGGAGPAAVDFRISELYKFAYYVPGATTGFAHTYAVIV